MLEFLRDLLGHCEWANAVFFHTWGKGPARDHEELRKRVEHILGVQQGFLAVLRGDAAGMPPDGPPAGYDNLKAWAEKLHGELTAYLRALPEAELARTVSIPWIPGCTITASEALVQTAMHTQHHRGQCMTRLKDFGGEPKNVDWIIWVWKNKPTPRWTSEAPR
jgi:uncharacterized damage-inducible protein DinB